ncbi:MAG: hypothetical protein LBK25_02040 [Treponema sp.]|nr:hypothetical protein [Treponema sp.]
MFDVSDLLRRIGRKSVHKRDVWKKAREVVEELFASQTDKALRSPSFTTVGMDIE